MYLMLNLSFVDHDPKATLAPTEFPRCSSPLGMLSSGLTTPYLHSGRSGLPPRNPMLGQAARALLYDDGLRHSDFAQAPFSERSLSCDVFVAFYSLQPPY
jgi:hypothetical protein